jgi:class 3 adenylate cyclase
MQLIRCHEQKSKSLDDFYTDISNHDGSVDREIGKTMLALIARLRSLPDDRQAWGLTSHYRLCLLGEDSSATPWFVIISALDTRDYYVEYLMPERVAPWPHAYVRGEASSEDDAVQMILTAMERSEGWSERQ